MLGLLLLGSLYSQVHVLRCVLMISGRETRPPEIALVLSFRRRTAAMRLQGQAKRHAGEKWSGVFKSCRLGIASFPCEGSFCVLSGGCVLTMLSQDCCLRASQQAAPVSCLGPSAPLAVQSLRIRTQRVYCGRSSFKERRLFSLSCGRLSEGETIDAPAASAGTENRLRPSRQWGAVRYQSIPYLSWRQGSDSA